MLSTCLILQPFLADAQARHTADHRHGSLARHLREGGQDPRPRKGCNVGTTYADIGFGPDFEMADRVNGDLPVAWLIDADPGAAAKNPRFLSRLTVNAF